jgi:hypothetical protein
VRQINSALLVRPFDRLRVPAASVILRVPAIPVILRVPAASVILSVPAIPVILRVPAVPIILSLSKDEQWMNAPVSRKGAKRKRKSPTAGQNGER